MKPLFQLGIALTLVFSMHAGAGVIKVTEINASSTFKSFVAENLVNGKGLKGEKHTAGNKGKWIGSKNDMPSLVFDFGDTFKVSSATIWNFGNNNKRNVKNILVESSLDGIIYKSVADLELKRTVGKLFAGEVFALDTLARFIRFDIQSNYGARFSGLSEVQFQGEFAAAPEPGSMVMMLMGLAALLVIGRKHHINQAA